MASPRSCTGRHEFVDELDWRWNPSIFVNGHRLTVRQVEPLEGCKLFDAAASDEEVRPLQGLELEHVEVSVGFGRCESQNRQAQ